MSDVRQVAKRGVPRERPLRIGGGRAWYMMLVLPYRTLANVIDGVVITFVNVTELKRAELRAAELAGIVESSQDAIVGQTLDGTITSWNRGAEILYGYSAAEVIGRNSELLVPKDRIAEVVAIRGALNAGSVPEPVETVRIRKNAATVDVSLAFSGVSDEAGRRVGFAVIARNISLRKQIERDAEQLRGELEETSRNKDEFLAMLGHELRNPLAAMMGALSLVQRSTDPAQVARATAVLDRQLRHLARLVDDLLDLSRVSRGKIELQREPLDLTDIVRSVVDDQQLSFQSRGISLDYVAPTSPLLVLGDRVRLCQVVGNLLSNSLKFTDRGGRVSLDLSLQGEMATLVVEDTGIGIAPSALPSIFGMFVQAETSHSRAMSGLGLGLAVSKRLIEMHGGTIEARSLGLDKGASFTVRLRISRIAPTAPAAVLPTKPALGKRILLIEDNEEIAIILRSLLEMSGHTVESALDGPTGIEVARRFAPEIILCDIGLPGGMDGYDVARAIRADSTLKKVLLVAVTGYAREEDRVRALAAGFDTHVRKPIDIDALDRIIATAHS